MHRSCGRLEFSLLDIGHGMLPIESNRQKYWVNTLCVSGMHRRIAMRCLLLVFAVWLILLSSPTWDRLPVSRRCLPLGHTAYSSTEYKDYGFSPHALQCPLHSWSLIIRCRWSGLTNTTRIPRPIHHHDVSSPHSTLTASQRPKSRPVAPQRGPS